MPRLLAAIAVVAMLAGGCGDGAEERSSTAERAGPASPPAAASTPTTAAAPSPGGGAVAVPELLRFTAAGVDGGQVDGSAFAGRDVALWFWAPW